MFFLLSSLEEDVLETIKQSSSRLTFDNRYLEACKELQSYGFIEGVAFDGGYIAMGITLAGERYFQDKETYINTQKRESRRSSLQKWLLALIPPIITLILGVLIGKYL